MFCGILCCLVFGGLLSASAAQSCPETPSVKNSMSVTEEVEGQVLGTYFCIKGYHLQGKKSFVCNASEEWVASATQCRLGHCPDPVLENGEFNSSGPVNVSDIITFKCNDHYILKGSTWSQCLEDHSWAPPFPACKSRDCGPPEKPAHGYFEGAKFTSGSTITFHCEKRYRLVGTPEQQCVDGEWSSALPACELIPEASTPVPPMGFERAFAAGERRRFDRGYQRSPRGTRKVWAFPGGAGQFFTMEVALDLNSEREQRKLSEKHQVLRPPRAPNGTLHRKGALRAWPFSGLCGVSHPALFQITLVASLLATVLGRCGPPPVLLFASPTMELNQTEFETETVLKYTCRPGYTRSSSVQTLTCNISGRWKYNVFCIKKRCRNPGDLPNGIMEIKTDFFLGSQIEFSCLEGYILVGPSTSVCEIQDKAVDWSAPFPVCEIVKCESPPDISNGKHSGEDEDLYTYGSSVTYSCDPNYSLVGNASISCVVVNKTVGVWSPRPPTCEKIICRQPTIPHAKILSGFGPIYTLKDSIMFSCQKGFVLRGSSVIHCEADNTWSPSPPVCEPKVCCAAPEVKHGGSIETKAAFTTDCPYSHKDVIFYRCPGRQMRSATCQLDGTWSAHTPLCSQGCEVPPSIAHGHYEKVSSYFSSYTFVYKCDEGYKLVGQEKLSCKDSQWLPEAPQCKAQCLKPKIADGKLSVNKPLYVESENITIHCNAGFGVVGSRSITCSGNRTWYPEVPRCEWEVLEGCEQVIAGRKLMQCLSNPAEVQMALEVYKLSLEIELLQLQIDKAGQSTRES